MISWVLVVVSKQKACYLVVFPNHEVYISWPTLDVKLMPGLNPDYIDFLYTYIRMINLIYKLGTIKKVTAMKYKMKQNNWINVCHRILCMWFSKTSYWIFTFFSNNALYSFTIICLNCRYHHSSTLNPLLNRIKIPWKRVLLILQQSDKWYGLLVIHGLVSWVKETIVEENIYQ